MCGPNAGLHHNLNPHPRLHQIHQKKHWSSGTKTSNKNVLCPQNWFWRKIPTLLCVEEFFGLNHHLEIYSGTQCFRQWSCWRFLHSEFLIERVSMKRNYLGQRLWEVLGKSKKKKGYYLWFHVSCAYQRLLVILVSIFLLLL